jgi:hypothetical protein
MADAAAAWLASLDDVQRKQAVWLWPSDEERHRWFYTPTDHGGLSLADMRPAQQRLAMRLVASGLSKAGYVTVSTIMGLENVLDQVEGWQVGWGRARGRDAQLYWLRIFGAPQGDQPWSWRFGGHHVSVQHTVVNGEVRASTPLFFGADPANSPLLGPHPLRPLAGAEDLARDLVRSLDEAQTARALLTAAAPVDIVTANRPRVQDGDQVLPLPEIWRTRFTERDLIDRVETMHRNAELKAGLSAADQEAVRFTTTPKGIRAGDLSVSQQDQLRALLDVYLQRIPDDLATAEAGKFAGTRLNDVHFAWAGSTEPGRPHYYRMQGPRLLVEYDNTQRDANHVHSVWRDPDGDFGYDVLANHRATHHARSYFGYFMVGRRSRTMPNPVPVGRESFGLGQFALSPRRPRGTSRSPSLWAAYLHSGA